MQNSGTGYATDSYRAYLPQTRSQFGFPCPCDGNALFVQMLPGISTCGPGTVLTSIWNSTTPQPYMSLALSSMTGAGRLVMAAMS